MVRAATIALVLLGACGTDASPELVVRDAAMGGGVPTLLGAEPGAVYWSVTTSNSPTKLVAGGSLATLPVEAQTLGMASGPIAQVGDHVVYAAGGSIVRASVTIAEAKVASVVAEALGESLDTDPVLVWTAGGVVSWGNGDVMDSVTLSRIVRCDHLRITATSIYVAADGSSERRLLRIDRKTGAVFPLSASSTHAVSFPGGEATGATYRGRLVGADEVGALWLVEETAAGATSPERAILLSIPEQGDAIVLLEHVNGASGFFTRSEAFYWQEGDALLTAPRSGGAASIVHRVTGTVGAIDSGFIYYVEGSTIERLALDGAD